MQLIVAAVMIIRTALTASAASHASVTQDTPETAETHAKVVGLLVHYKCFDARLAYCWLKENKRPIVM